MLQEFRKYIHPTFEIMNAYDKGKAIEFCFAQVSSTKQLHNEKNPHHLTIGNMSVSSFFNLTGDNYFVQRSFHENEVVVILSSLLKSIQM